MANYYKIGGWVSSAIGRGCSLLTSILKYVTCKSCAVNKERVLSRLGPSVTTANIADHHMLHTLNVINSFSFSPFYAFPCSYWANFALLLPTSIKGALACCWWCIKAYYIHIPIFMANVWFFHQLVKYSCMYTPSLPHVRVWIFLFGLEIGTDWQMFASD